MIDLDNIVTEIRRLAAENPDKTAQCKYLNEDDSPCCIVGHAVVNLGVNDEFFEAAEKAAGVDGSLGFNTVGASAVFGELGFGVKDKNEAVAWISYAQRMQDYGHTWGEAVGLVG